MLELCHACVAAQKVLGWPRAGATTPAPAARCQVCMFSTWAPSASTVAFVTGLGCALVFPALGVEALKRVLPANRGSAMGAFVAFRDIAYGISGPAAGIIAGQFCFAAVYLLGAACALLGGALVATAHNPQS
jgi:predicted MFS family arabinose efflux permease